MSDCDVTIIYDIMITDSNDSKADIRVSFAGIACITEVNPYVYDVVRMALQ